MFSRMAINNDVPVVVNSFINLNLEKQFNSLDWLRLDFITKTLFYKLRN